MARYWTLRGLVTSFRSFVVFKVTAPIGAGPFLCKYCMGYLKIVAHALRSVNMLRTRYV